MLLRLLILMTVVPVVELFILLQVHGSLAAVFGSAKALLITIGSILLTGVLGANLARSQGFQLLTRIQAKLAKQQMPGADLVEGAMVLVGGVLLLTPGYFTDLVGFALLIPMSRALLRTYLLDMFKRQVQQGNVHVHFQGSVHQQQDQRPKSQQFSDVIDVEVKDLDKP